MKKIACAVLVLLGGCLDSLGPEVEGNQMSAEIDGRRQTGVTYISGSRYGNSIYLSAGGNDRSVTVFLENVPRPGIYPIMSTTGTGSYYEGPADSHWETRGASPQGFVRVTSITHTRIKGTFSFIVEPITSSASGTRRITDGKFDLTMHELVDDAVLRPLSRN